MLKNTIDIIEEKPMLVYSRDEISEIIILVSTNKGAFFYFSDADRRHWDVSGPHFIGSIIYHMVLDPRDNRTILISVESKINGSNIYRSKDFGKTWIPAEKQPIFDEKNKKKINHIFCLTPGHKEELGLWYAGTSPHGLFCSKNNGKTWEPIESFNNNKKIIKIAKKQSVNLDKTLKINSIIVDSSNKKQLFIAMSYGGVFQSKDHGLSWEEVNNGINISKNEDNQNPHSIIQHPHNPKRLYQQNYCGIYRIDFPESLWYKIGDNMPIEIGDKGFAITIHPNDENTIWVFPIDKTETESEVCSDGQPALYCSKDGGDSWFRQDIGLPMRNAWFSVYRKSLNTDSMNTAGVYFGTTSGSIWMSDNEGNSWRQIAVHLPKILAIETGKILK